MEFIGRLKHFMLAIFILTTLKPKVLVGSQVILTPANATVNENESLTLTCSYISGNNDQSSSFWHIPGINSSVPVAKDNASCVAWPPLNDSAVYQHTCIDSNSYTITIKKVSRKQHGDQWQCEQVFHKSNFATIYVKVVLASVAIAKLSSSVLSLKESEQVFVVCSTSSSRPTSTIFWRIGSNTSQPLNGTVINQIEQASGLVSTTNTLSLIAHRSMNGKKLYCFGNNTVDNFVSDWLILNVTYLPSGPPSMQGLNNGTSYALIEHTEVYLLCVIGDSNPPAELTWSCNDTSSKIVTSVNNISKSLRWIASRSSSGQCICNSSHAYGSPGIAVVNIHVLFPPENISVQYVTASMNESNIEDFLFIIENTTISLTCSATGNPLPIVYSWSGLNKSHSAVLELTTVRGMVGNITCHTENVMVEVPKNISSLGKLNRTFVVDVLYPPVVKLPVERRVVEDSSFSILCEITKGNPEDVTVVWTTKLKGVISNSLMLSLNKVTVDDEGMYMCSANNTMTPTYGPAAYGTDHKSFYLEVLHPPKHLHVSWNVSSMFEENITDVLNVIEDTFEEMTLNCSADGNPIPGTYFWTGHLQSESSMITLPVKRNISGNFTCYANNSMDISEGSPVIGHSSKTIRIGVLYPPAVEAITDKTVEEGSNLSISCPTIPGYSTHQSVAWFRNEVQISNSEVLSLLNVTKDDHGIYTCRLNYTMTPSYGSAKYGMTSRSINIDVLYKAEVRKFYFARREEETAVFVNESDSVYLVCTVDSNPDPTIELMFENNILARSSKGRILIHHIDTANCFSTGVYRCFGYNYLNRGQLSLKNLQLFVYCSPRASPSFQLRPNITTILYLPTILNITVTAYPPPVGRWYKYNSSHLNEMKEGLRHTSKISLTETQFTCTFENVTESLYGKYRLETHNDVGQYGQTFNLNPPSTSTAPTSYGYYEDLVTDRSVTVWWEPGFDGGLPQSFIISYANSASQVFVNLTKLDDSAKQIINFTLDGLESGVIYHIWIYAGNELGSERVPNKIIVRTRDSPTIGTEQSRTTMVYIAAGSGSAACVCIIIAVIVVVRHRNIKRKRHARRRAASYVNQTTEAMSDEQKELGYVSLCSVVKGNTYEDINRMSENKYEQIATPGRQAHTYNNMKEQPDTAHTYNNMKEQPDTEYENLNIVIAKRIGDQ